MSKMVLWIGKVGEKDDFGEPIEKTFYDAKTKQGPWAIMSEKSWKVHGLGKLGLGYGQKYEQRIMGAEYGEHGSVTKWVKVGG